jgi:hypothetical protein
VGGWIKRLCSSTEIIMWIVDPKTKKPSVSLTMLVVAMLLMVSFIILESFAVLKSTMLLDEFFLVSVGLYFGRRKSDLISSITDKFRK